MAAPLRAKRAFDDSVLSEESPCNSLFDLEMAKGLSAQNIYRWMLCAISHSWLGVIYSSHPWREKCPYLLITPIKTPVNSSELLRSPVIGTGTQATRGSRPGIDMDKPLLDLSKLNGAEKLPDSTVPEQIQAPTKVKRLLKLKKLRCTNGQDAQALTCTLEGKMFLWMAHGHPPDPTFHKHQSSSFWSLHQFKGPCLHMSGGGGAVLDKSAGAHTNPRSDPDATHTNPDLI